MKHAKKITKKMLMNCYGDETYRMCREVSREAAFRWLAEANRFFAEAIGIKKILENEKKLKKIGW